MSDHQPIQQEYRDAMNEVAKFLNQVFAPNSFILLMMEPGERGSGKRTNYISNSNRDDMHRVLQEFLDDERINFEGMDEQRKQIAVEERAHQLIDLAKKLNRKVTITGKEVKVVKTGN